MDAIDHSRITEMQGMLLRLCPGEALTLAAEWVDGVGSDCVDRWTTITSIIVGSGCSVEPWVAAGEPWAFSIHRPEHVPMMEALEAAGRA